DGVERFLGEVDVQHIGSAAGGDVHLRLLAAQAIDDVLAGIQINRVDVASSRVLCCDMNWYTTCWIAGLPPQKASLRFRISLSRGWYELIWNGPVPTGCVFRLTPASIA